MRALFKEPLIQFFVGGIVLFLMVTLFKPNTPEADDVITISDDTLATYLQYRSKAFDTSSALEALAVMDSATRAQITEEYITEEILYREALKLGLETGDDVIRKRLAQKMTYLLQGFDDGTWAPDEEDARAYFEENVFRYREEARASFTHIFLNTTQRSPETASTELSGLKDILNQTAVAPAEAGTYGDRFPFFRTYANRTERLITDHFGETVRKAVFEDAPKGQWIGPISSPYGMHLIYVSSRHETKEPTLEGAYPDVVADMRRDHLELVRQKAIQKLRDGYRITNQ
ncbi:MAG: peptidyl-prolyl cis-trans isomerase [Alphaproteobacteria bacterium]|nr:peptidyl-prolyl cis-trans isomerase [Alphaproteobacteria bacterium]